MGQVEFDEVRFPEDVSYGSSGGPVFKTQVFEGFRGFEKRNIDWASPLMEFDISYGIKTTEQMALVAAFFNAREGRLRGFRYKNWANYQIVNDNIAVGDGVSNRLPLIRTYGFPATQTYKRLYKIVLGSVRRVTIGSELLIEGEDFAIDYNGGEIITASNRVVGEGVPVKAENLEFDEPVRFDVDTIAITMEQFNNNSLGRVPLIGVRDTFTAGTVPGPDGSIFASVESNDQFFGSVRALLKFDDAEDDLTTTFDQSRNLEPVTIVSPAILITDSVAAGYGAINFGTTGRLEMDASRFNLSNSATPFCAEVFIRRPDGLIGENTQMIFGKWADAGSNKSYMLYYTPSQQRLIWTQSVDGVAESILLNYPWTEAGPEDWQHLCVERLATGAYIMRVNGLVVQTGLDANNFNNTNSIPFTMGGFVSTVAGQGTFQGDMDSFRFTYGRTRYGIEESLIQVPQADYPT